MRSLKLEQVAVIKFLALEGSEKQEIYTRLKKIFSTFTLPLKKVNKLYFHFLKEGLLGLQEKLVYEDEMMKREESHRTPNSLSESPGTEDGEQWSDERCTPKKVPKSQLETEHANFSNDARFSKKYSNEGIFSVEDSGTEDSNIISRNYEPEVNIIELSNSDMLEDDSESGSGTEDSLEFYNSFENEVLEDADQLLPIMPTFNVPDSIKYLERLHPDFNCLLCEGRQFTFRSHLKVHLSFHIKHSATLFNHRSLLCKRNCLNNNRGHYHCSLCTMISPHLSRVKHHFKKVHNNMAVVRTAGNRTSEKCTCVDPVGGIFLVLKSKYDLAEPIHVQKRNFGRQGTLYSRCSQEICQKAMETAKLNGNFDLECKHLKEVKIQYRFQPPHFTLNENTLKEIGLSQEEILKCLSVDKIAYLKSSALVVEWVANHEVIYFSVFCNESFAVMGRTLVVLNTKDNLYICSCPKRSNEHFCLYKTVSEVYYHNGFMET